MDLEALKKLVKKGECLTLEFKKSTTQMKEACKTLCAFLNAEGGVILIGVEDSGNLVGQDVTDNTKQEIANYFKKIEPHVHVNVDYVVLPTNQKTILCLNVPAGLHKPYIFDGRAWTRIESTTSLLSQEAYEQLLLERGRLNHSWEEQPAFGYSIEDLDLKELRRTVQQGIHASRLPPEAESAASEEILTQFELLKNGQPNNAAIVLFGKKIKSSYSQCMIKMARFRGTKKTDEFIDNKQIYGNAFKLLSEAELFIRRHLPIAGYLVPGEMRRIDKPALPPLATREALINAVCHRDYSDRYADISLAIYDDRLEIWNSGNLVKPMTLSDLMKGHDSKRRNKLISEVFYKRGFIERWGTGTLRMIDLCKENELPMPGFSQYSGGFSVTFTFEKSIGPEIIKVNSLQMGVKEPITEFEDVQFRILQLLKKHGEMRSKELLAVFQGEITERALRYVLEKLKKLKKVGTKGRAQQATWFVLNKDAEN